MSDQKWLGTTLRSLPPHEHGPAPVEALLERGRRARRARRVRAASFAAAGTSAAAVLAVVLPVAPSAERPQGASARPPGVSLVSAVEGTAKSSFRVRLSYTMTRKGRQELSETYTGAFDAASRSGWLRGPGRVPMEHRFIGDDYYVYRGTWKRVPQGFNAHADMAVPNELSPNPGSLLGKLAEMGKVRKLGRTGTVETFAFSYAPAHRRAGIPAPRVITGTVAVGLKSRKVERIEQQAVVQSLDPGIADREPITFRSVVELSAYGVPVNVHRPA